jgi:site-specific DNA-methyltransferase (adenine-specific)
VADLVVCGCESDDGENCVSKKQIKPYWQSKDSCVTLYCGDCREILPQLPAGSVDFVFMDPPYGHNNNNNGDLIARWEDALGRGTSGAARPIANDGAEADELVRWSFGEARRLLRGCCCCCCCCGGGPDPQFARWSLWLNEMMAFKQMVVWDKGPMGMGWHYRRSYETVLVAQVPGAACRWFDRTRKVENIIRPGTAGISKIIPAADQHPTEKPWQLPLFFIKLHSMPGDVVCDPFLGGGSTAVAAVKMGCCFIGIDIEEQHCNVARKKNRGRTIKTVPYP